ncbi:MAG: ABC transporter ATP-binding protein [Deltaproteobacteria bacterium]|nr:ABC transporter ATP-binding protein [Deltaproteobacteria bacterium]
MTSKPEPPSLLRLTNIETLYDDRICVLRGLSLEVKAGRIFSLIGPNGAGKTTLLKTIAGLLKDQPRKGTIELMGRQIQRRVPESIASLGVVYVPEDRGLFRELTVRENLDLACWGNSRAKAREALRAVYDLFPILKEKAEHQAENLSGGQQQMLAVARALLRGPKLLMVDEPSLGLAPRVAKDVYRALLKVSETGTTILLVEQNAVLALGVSDYCYIMEGGRVVLEGTPEKLKDNDDFKQLYLGIGEGEDAAGWKLYRKRRRW